MATSFPNAAALGNEGIGDELQTETGIRKALMNWFQAAGINPFQNPYAARLIGRAAEVARLQPFYGLGDAGQRAQFIRDWAQSQWTGGTGSYDTSRRGITGRMDQSVDVNGQPVNLFRTGDPDADANTFREILGLANRGYGDRLASTADRLEAQKGLQYGAWQMQNPNFSGLYADWRMGTTPTTNAFTPPGGTSGGGTTPPAGTPGGTPTFTPPAGGTTPTSPSPAPQPTPAPNATNPWLSTPNRPTTPGYSGFSPERGTVYGNPALVFKQFQDVIANASPHITSPGQSSMLLPGGWQYSAPNDVERRYWVAGSTGREPGGAAKGASGWNLLRDWIVNLRANNPNLTPEQAMAAAMQYLTNRAGGDPARLARFGFSRVG
ncbi:MAG TPA: hypothetical protein VF104_07070 [Burkholderiales bacterium]